MVDYDYRHVAEGRGGAQAQSVCSDEEAQLNVVKWDFLSSYCHKHACLLLNLSKEGPKLVRSHFFV